MLYPTGFNFKKFIFLSNFLSFTHWFIWFIHETRISSVDCYQVNIEYQFQENVINHQCAYPLRYRQNHACEIIYCKYLREEKPDFSTR